jgi:hypothetical protein
VATWYQVATFYELKAQTPSTSLLQFDYPFVYIKHSKGVLNIKKKDVRVLSQVLIGGAVISVAFSALGYLGTDIWLASTQWLLVSVVFGLFGVYARMES